ncbi:hypothetical protein Dshi_0170 [Dinoroseobacter shibae DFL 12 = DSM 16493]|jgi:hypothetical protein|uniref:Uncharacterized protein n=1 Tax=Dinoroseobacter shibae (strain DSM 16493 / NCIMB 14021 / DFL 12) TaxID=398580 RepID=A8LKS6_DINSH|nr:MULTISPECIES: DUF6732 family protein [Dinoroseobacter]ABV91919.1 hypothetical protein Dshi_0170 [Dinoroseobacter shibae DFL 12 = DSM 16493]MDD9717302.1 hypothetical protein [Dinoroseobacter sp. PD6]URF46894.1 hypothetical protein M8008_00865 [Dinoroseobacter shibae]URF51205.1 hypothetical protein M8007_00865 [Dinoroseobacter shibae]
MPLLPLYCLAVLAGMSAAPALAHPGHLAGLAGHDHWVAGAAIGAAIAIGLFGALKGRKSRADHQPEEAADAAEADSAEART